MERTIPKQKPLKQRIREAYRPGICYRDLMFEVFPDPNSHGYSQNGGPPGCAMAFGKALREMGAFWGRPGEPVHLPKE